MSSKTLFWCALLVSLILFLAPVRVEQASGLGLDKAVHFIIFAVLGYYGIQAYRQQRVRLLGLLTAYAFIIEYVQNAYFARTLDWYDSVSGIIALGIIYLHKK